MRARLAGRVFVAAIAAAGLVALGVIGLTVVSLMHAPKWTVTIAAADMADGGVTEIVRSSPLLVDAQERTLVAAPNSGAPDAAAPAGATPAADGAASSSDPATAAKDPEPDAAARPEAEPTPELPPETSNGTLPEDENTDTEALPLADPSVVSVSGSRFGSSVKGRKGAAKGSMTILQIGDSHTAADIFTGEVRRRLQASYGDGGRGYFIVGRPHPGVMHAGIDVDLSDGWDYRAIQKSKDGRAFALAGFSAVTSDANRTLTVSTDGKIAANFIEIETERGPDAGAIDVLVDGAKISTLSLKAAKQQRIMIKVEPQDGRPHLIRKVVLRTTGSGAVDLGSVGIFNTTYGISYSAVGYPGATIGLLAKFDDRLVRFALQAINPQIIVLAFGTNEGFNDDLDVDRYRALYRERIETLQSMVPGAQVVLIGPADGRRKKGDDGDACGGWTKPPKLDAVRAAQKEVANALKLPYWDWGSIMPEGCGADAWFNRQPRFMAKDRVHMSGDGYRYSAQKFTAFLKPYIDQLRVGTVNALPNN